MREKEKRKRGAVGKRSEEEVSAGIMYVTAPPGHCTTEGTVPGSRIDSLFPSFSSLHGVTVVVLRDK